MLTMLDDREDSSPPDGDLAHRTPVPEVLIYDNESLRITRFVHEYPSLETGGDLFGHWTHQGNPVVSFVLGPGRQSRHNVTSFFQDTKLLYDVGVRLYDRYGLVHVGEWHSHHRLGLNEPSCGDIRTVQRGMAVRGWRRFLLMIATLDAHPSSPVVHNYYLFGETDTFRPAAVASLPGSSPFRTRPGEPGEESTHRQVAQLRWTDGPNSPATRAQALPSQYAEAWFSTPAGKVQVRRIVSDLKRKGIIHRIYATQDGRSLKLRLPKASLLLGPNFPNQSPRIVPAGRSCRAELCTPHWDSDKNLVDWYCSLSQR